MAARRVAVLSDVHGFLTALRAVLAEIDSLGIAEIVVAGDTVNFGPKSAEVVDLLRERNARMIRGNHEIELIVPWHLVTTGQATEADIPALGGPAGLMSSPRYCAAQWTNQQLGPERRAFLSALPDRLALDECTIVTHGSPRGVRDGIRPEHTADELRTKWNADPATLVFVGHIHRPHIADIPPSDPTEPPRRFVNVGSVGMNLDGDPRAAYAIAEHDLAGDPFSWNVTLRRIAYDVDAALREYDDGMRDACPEYVESFSRQVRTGNHYFGPWVRLSQHLPDDALLASLRQYLDDHP
ncbi:MAG TPA: metallophosphoesterase family protein [Chloroflexota bacterium]|nr:metallophosphoesterase family protein [Chloroflexota bacterium]